MSDLKALARAILEHADAVTPLIPGSIDDTAVAAGKSLLSLFNRFGEISNASADELAAKREEIEARILGDLRDEADTLRG